MEGFDIIAEPIGSGIEDIFPLGGCFTCNDFDCGQFSIGKT